MKPIVYLDMDETLLHTRGYLTRPPSQARIEEARRLKPDLVGFTATTPHMAAG